MAVFIRFLQRAVILAVALLVIWGIVTQVFHRLDQRAPLFVALVLTYALSAYVILPRVIHLTLLVLRRKHLPRFTRANDGLPADPVNVIVLGSEAALRAAFAKAGWHEADPLTPRTAWKMAVAFVRDAPYPEAPFSRLFLFGRTQDIGFEQPIGRSPRQRHHVRFWAAHADELPDPLNAGYWTRKQRVDRSGDLMWIGAGTKDTGFGLAALTYQITHAVDPYVDEERDYILSSLQGAGCVEDVAQFDSGTFEVRKYRSDGKITVLTLT